MILNLMSSGILYAHMLEAVEGCTALMQWSKMGADGYVCLPRIAHGFVVPSLRGCIPVAFQVGSAKTSSETCEI